MTPSAPGEMTVLVGTPAELSPLFASLPDGAASAPVAGFVQDAKTGLPVLVITGPTWQAIRSAIESIVAPTDVAGPVRRDVITTQRCAEAPDALFLFSDTRLAFFATGAEDRGVLRQAFSHRFFHRHSVGLLMPPPMAKQ